MHFKYLGMEFRQNSTLRFLWVRRQIIDYKPVNVGFVTDDFGTLVKIDLECLRVSLS